MTHIEKLRDLLFTPTVKNWKQICKLLERLEGTSDFDATLDYACTHLDAWPREIAGITDGWPQSPRRATEQWLEFLLDGESPPAAWPVVRCIQMHLHTTTDERLRNLVGSEAMSRITSLQITNCGLSWRSSAPFVDGHFDALETLILDQNRLGRGFLDELASSELGARLRTLCIGDCRLRDHALETLAEGGFSALEVLSVERNKFDRNNFSDEALARLVASEALPSLRFLVAWDRSTRRSIPTSFEGPEHMRRALVAGYLCRRPTTELKSVAKEAKLKGRSSLSREELILALAENLV